MGMSPLLECWEVTALTGQCRVEYLGPGTCQKSKAADNSDASSPVPSKGGCSEKPKGAGQVYDCGWAIRLLHGLSLSLKPPEAGAPTPARQGFLQWGGHTAPPNGPQRRSFISAPRYSNCDTPKQGLN